LGFIPEVQSGLVLDEDSEDREVLLMVARQPNRCRQRLIQVPFPHAAKFCVESQKLLLVGEVTIEFYSKSLPFISFNNFPEYGKQAFKL